MISSIVGFLARRNVPNHDFVQANVERMVRVGCQLATIVAEIYFGVSTIICSTDSTTTIESWRSDCGTLAIYTGGSFALSCVTEVFGALHECIAHLMERRAANQVAPAAAPPIPLPPIAAPPIAYQPPSVNF